MVAYSNNTGLTVTNLSVSYNIYRFRTANTATTNLFYFSTNPASWGTARVTNSWAAVASTNYFFNTNVAASNTATVSQHLIPVTISNGAVFYMSWIFTAAADGNGQGLGLDNFSLTAQTQAAVATPTITAVTLGSALTNTYGTASAGVSYTATGTNLTGQITNTPVTGWEISTNNSTWTTNATAVNTNTTVWVRTAATRAAGTNNSTAVVTLASSGATNTNVTTSASGNVVSQKGLTITGLTAADKNWDGTTTASVTGTPAFSGLANSESFAVAGTVTWAFPDANVGSNKTLTRTGSYDAPSANYSVTQPTLTASINAVAPSAPSITGITAGDTQFSVAFTAPSSNGGSTITNYEYSTNGGTSWTTPSPAATSSPLVITGLVNGTTYDVQLRAVNSAGSGTATATTQGTPVAPASPTITALPGVLGSALSATYGTPSATQSFTVSGATLSGNLTVTAPTGLQVSTNSSTGFASSLELIAASGSVSSTTIHVRLPATAAVGTYNSQNITVSGGGATTQNVATTSSGNTVSQAPLTITGISIASKVYDGNTTATISGTAAYSGLVGGETFSIAGTPGATFANKTVANAKSVTVSGYEAPSANYSITQPAGLTANITAKELTVSDAVAANKVYDATTSATITGNLSGVVSGDTVTLSGTGTFASANLGTGIAVTSTSTLGGADAGNYSLTQPIGLSADITQATQTITFGALTNVTAGTTNALTATASSGLAVSYSSANTNVATISGTNVIAVAAGVTTITASQAGNSNVAAASPVSQVLNVSGGGDLGTPTSTQNFGTTAATNSSTTGNTTTIPNPTGSGTTWARGGAAAPNAPIIVATNTPNPLGTTGAYLRAVASSSTSVSKASPTASYTNATTEFYTSFKVLFGNSSGVSGADTGSWAFYQGTGAMYTDASDFAGAQVFSGLRFAYGASGAITLNYRSGSSWVTTSLTSSSFTQGTVYTVEIVANNKSSGGINYTYSGNLRSVAVQTFDLYINGTLVGDDLARAQLPAGNTINATTFIGQSSTSNAANIFVDDFVVYNAVPASIGGASPAITPSGTFPALTTTYGTASTNTNSVLVSGGSLTSNITATPPAGFEVSTNGSAWSSNAVFTQTDGFANGTLYLRLAANAAAGSYTNRSVALVAGSVSNSIAISNSTVGQYPITVGAVATNKVYGNADPALTYTNAPLLFSDTFSGSITRAAGTNAGTYAITQGTLTNANYDITFLTNSFTITPKALTITADSVTKAFGVELASPQTGSTAFTSGGLVSGESISSVTITYTDGAGSGAAPGTYTDAVVPSAPVGIDTNNYTITFVADDLTVDASPTITVGTSSLPAFSTTYGTDSSTQTFTVTGGSLTGDVTVTAPAGFQVSTNASADFASSVELTSSANAVPTTTIYVRVPGTANASTNLSGNIEATSAGATTRNVSIAASTVSPKALTIGDLSATNRVYDATTNGTVSGTPVYVGLTNSQSFEVTNNVIWSFANKNVGTNKALAASADFTAPSANYTIASQPAFSADITQATLTLSGAAATPRAYVAGNTNVTITGTLSGVFEGDTVGFTGTGTIASANAGTNIPVTANVTLTGADAGNYTLTQPESLTVDITKATNTITFGALSNVTVGTTNALTATASSGLAVTYTSSNTNVATISGSNVIAVAPGVTTITASQAGDGNFDAATPVAQSLTVNAGPTVLAVGDIAIIGFNANAPDGFAFVTWVDLNPNTVIKFTDNGFLSANSANSTNNGRGGENFVTWTNSTGAVIPAGTVITIIDGTPATTSQGSVSQTLGGLATGGDQIFAYQGPGAGTTTSNSDFGSNANPSTFTGTILFGLNYGAAWLTSGTASASTSYRPSELAVELGSIALATTSTTRGQYTGSRTGQTLAAFRAAVVNPANWTTGTSTGVITFNTTVFSIAQAQSITFGALSAVTYGDAPFALTATASSGLSVTYTSSNESVATVDGSTVTIVGAGSTTITASQAGDATFAAATPVAQTLTVNAASLAGGDITLSPVGDGSYTASGPAGSTFNLNYSGRTANGITTSYSSATAPTAAGYYTVTATATGNYTGSNNTSYFIAGPVAFADTVQKIAAEDSIVIEGSSLLANDRRIDNLGAVQTGGLTLSLATSGTDNEAQVDGSDVLFLTTGGSAPWTFTYTIMDAANNTAVATVTVNNDAVEQPFTLQIVRIGSAAFDGTNTSVTHDFVGVPNQTYLIEYSTDLATWTSAGNQSTGTSGSFAVTISRAGNFASAWNSAMFFRARLVTP
jgi:hypothetical protein